MTKIALVRPRVAENLVLDLPVCRGHVHVVVPRVSFLCSENKEIHALLRGCPPPVAFSQQNRIYNSISWHHRTSKEHCTTVTEPVVNVQSNIPWINKKFCPWKRSSIVSPGFGQCAKSPNMLSQILLAFFQESPQENNKPGFTVKEMFITDF